MPAKTKSTKAFIVACMNCHQQIGTLVYTLKAARTLADIHLSVTEKPHGDHEVTITPTTVVRKKK